MFPRSPLGIVCYTAVFSVVTQRGGALRDDTKNGCVADYARNAWPTIYIPHGKKENKANACIFRVSLC